MLPLFLCGLLFFWLGWWYDVRKKGEDDMLKVLLKEFALEFATCLFLLSIAVLGVYFGYLFRNKRKEVKQNITSVIKQYWKSVGMVAVMLVFPFALEKILFFIPDKGRFSRDEWFSFIASYTGAIATFIVLKITLKENQKAVEAEKERLKRNYEIEKELELVKEIQKVLLLDKYNFLDLSSIALEYAKYAKDILDVQYDIREVQFDIKGNSARDKYLTRLFLLERFHTTRLCVEEIPDLSDEESIRQYAKSFVTKASELYKSMTLQRKELLDLYKEYVHEMKMKEYE